MTLSVCVCVCVCVCVWRVIVLELDLQNRHPLDADIGQQSLSQHVHLTTNRVMH